MPLTSLLQRMFPSTVQAAEATEEDFSGELSPAEASFIASAVPVRQREFTGSRVCARRLLSTMGLAATAEARAFPEILPGSDRQPVWPVGVVGTISHTNGRCVVAVADAKDVSMLGVDIEVQRDLDADLWQSVCTDAELAWLSSQPSVDRGWLATLLFSVKECGYKAQFPLTHAFLEFTQGQVEIRRQSESAGTFAVRYPADVAELLPVESPQGCWAAEDGLIVTALTVTEPAGDAPPPGGRSRGQRCPT